MSIKKKKVADALDKLFHSASQPPIRTRNKISTKQQPSGTPDKQAEPVSENQQTAQEQTPPIKKKTPSAGVKPAKEPTAPLPVPVSEDTASIDQQPVISIANPTNQSETLRAEPKTNQEIAQTAVAIDELQFSPDNTTGQLNDQESMQLVVFTLGEEYFGVDIAVVESIIKMQDITVVPRSKPYVLGVTNLRGTVLPVINLRKRFSLAEDQSDENQRIVVVLINNEKIGLLVDNVSQVIRIPKQSIEPAPPLISSVNTTFITGIAKNEESLIILLELGKIFA